MKQSWYLALGLAVATLCTPLVAVQGQSGQAQSAQVMLEAARKAETIDGNPKAAIAQYEQIVKRFASDRAVVADALVRMAGAYKKLGDAQAKAIYERVVREYGDQATAASAARAALGPGAAPGAPASSGATAMRRVWSGPLVDTSGAVSPDGRHVAFVDARTGDLALHDLETNEDRRLTTTANYWVEFAGSVAYSPDGREIAFAWFGKNQRYEIRVVDPMGTGVPVPRTVFDRQDVDRIEVTDWSRDGKWLAVVYSTRDGGLHLARLGVADGTLSEPRVPLESRPTRVLFSPDGRFVAYDVLRNKATQDRDIVIRSIEGGTQSFVAPGPSYEVLMGWSPDGTALLFTSDRSGTRSLWAVDVTQGQASGVPRTINGGVGDDALGVTSRGALYVGITASMLDIHVAPIDLANGRRLGEPERPLRRRGGSNRSPSWSPDGTKLAFSALPARAGQGRSLGIWDMRTGEVRELHLDLDSLNFPRWSPDGRELLVWGRDKDGKTGIYKISVDTAAIAPVVMAAGYVDLPWWAPDGRRMYYTRRPPGGALAIVEHELETGREREVPGSRGFGNAALSPDGQYFVSGGASELRVLPASGGEPRVVHSVNKGEWLMWPNWASDSKHILVTHVVGDQTKPSETPLIVPLDGGAPKRLDLPGATARLMTMHPDGKRVAYLAGQDQEEVWVLENFLPQAKAARK